MLTGWKDFDDTFRTLDYLQRRIDRAFDPREVLAPRGRLRARAVWPATNVFETKEAFIVKADVPGLADKDVSVSVEEESLVIRGERKTEVPQGYRVHLRERAPVAFTRRLPLPARVDADAVSASLSEGILTVTLPKAREALPRQIAVKAG
jgi:HSP20 family protein